MLRPCLLARVGCRVLLGLAIVLASLTSARAEPLPKDGTKKFTEQWESREVRDTYVGLTKGQIGVANDNMPVIEMAAKWFTYRVTWTAIQKRDGGMGDLERELRTELKSLNDGKPGTNQYLQAFNKKAVACIKEVLTEEKVPVGRINAVRLLAVLAEKGYEESTDLIAEILSDDTQNDALKLWAVRGLGRFFEATRKVPGILFVNKDREAKCILAVLKFVDRKPAAGANASREEWEAFRYLRREGVRTLGLTRYPAVEVKGKIEGRTAQTLLNFVAGNVVPEPRLDERVDAALGVMNLNSSFTKSYQPDYAAHIVGRFLVDFAEQQRPDNRKGRLEKEPWKVWAAKWEDAIEVMAIDAKNVKPATAYVAEVHRLSTPILKAIETSNPTPHDQLSAWLGKNAPKSTTIYSGVADSVIKPPEGDKGAN